MTQTVFEIKVLFIQFSIDPHYGSKKVIFLDIFWLSLLLWSSYRFLAYDQATTLPSNDLKYLDSKLKSSCVKNWNSIHVPLVNNIAYSIFLSWPRKDSAFLDILNFRFSKKVTKFETISHMIWLLPRKFQIKWEIVSNFCGLFRMSELYMQVRLEKFGWLFFILVKFKQWVGLLAAGFNPNWHDLLN